jgi:hypothetical protein
MIISVFLHESPVANPTYMANPVHHEGEAFRIVIMGRVSWTRGMGALRNWIRRNVYSAGARSHVGCTADAATLPG